MKGNNDFKIMLLIPYDQVERIDDELKKVKEIFQIEGARKVKIVDAHHYLRGGHKYVLPGDKVPDYAACEAPTDWEVILLLAAPTLSIIASSLTIIRALKKNKTKDAVFIKTDDGSYVKIEDGMTSDEALKKLKKSKKKH